MFKESVPLLLKCAIFGRTELYELNQYNHTNLPI